MYILPEPHILNMKQGNFILTCHTEILLSDTLGSQEFLYAKILKEQAEEILKFTFAIGKACERIENTVFLSISEDLKPEEYRLIIVGDGILITGGGSNAVLYGVQSLCQIISQKGALLPCLEILDYPELPNRGYFYDVTRGRIPTLNYLKKLADKLSYYKMNQLQLYVEHSFLFRGLSEVWRDDTPLTAQEILELDEYCRIRNIELIPSIASFGHLYKLLRTRTCRELCELASPEQAEFSFVGRMLHHTLDVTNEKSFALIKKLILEYMPLFTSRQFNICADETFDLGTGKSRPAAEAIGTDQVYIMFLKRLCGIIEEKGRLPMFWGDIILSKPEAIKELGENVICLNWDYSEKVSDLNVRKLYELGVKQYLCPGVQGWKRMINRLDYAYQNISRMCGYAHRYKAEGVLNTDWGDYGHINPPECSSAGLIYGASFSWNAKQMDFEEINRRISVIEYRDRSAGFVSVVNDLSLQEGFLWGDAVEYKEMSQGRLLPDEREELLKKLHTTDFKLLNNRLEAAKAELYRVLGEMDSSKRDEVKVYLVMAEGIGLFNRLGILIKQSTERLPEEDFQKEAGALAVKLEYWWNEYKAVWRKQSKESELFQIQEVVFWYADLLRDLAVSCKNKGEKG